MTPIQLALLIFGVMLFLMVVRVPIAGATVSYTHLTLPTTSRV